MSTLTLTAAQAAIDAAQAHAAQIGVAMNIAVLDAGGHLKAFVRMDGAMLGSVDVAIRKARTSVLFAMKTDDLYEICKPGGMAPGLEHTNGGLVTFAGGVPMKGADGAMIGAIGVAGGSAAQDLEVAMAGLGA